MHKPARRRIDQVRRTFIASALWISTTILAACATLPSQPTGTTEPAFASASEIPRRVSLQTEMIGQADPVGGVLSDELPRMGFTVDYENAEGAFVAVTRQSEFGPSRLELRLVSGRSGRVLWTARIVREWDMHASLVEAHEQNTRKAMELLQEDLERVGFTRR